MVDHDGPRPDAGRGDNPFASARVRPGRIAYRFSPSVSAATLVDRLAQLGWWAQITGPHGSGKSTLLRTLLPHIEQRGRRVHLLTLSAGQRRFARGSADWRAWSCGAVVVVDGYEQLTRWSRFRLRRACRKRAAGLLVTAHADVGLPALLETRVTPDLARGVVADLLAGRSVTIAPGEVDAMLDRHHGNLRETLFALYDLYELRSRQP